MSTIYSLMEEGYTLEIPSILKHRINYDAELADYMYDPEKRIINYVPLLKDYKPEGVQLHYWFNTGKVFIAEALFNSKGFMYSHKVGVSSDLLFSYADFANELKDQFGELKEVTLGISFTNSTDTQIIYLSRYYPVNHGTGRAEAYSGTEIYIDGNLEGFDNNLLMYGISSFDDLKEKISLMPEVISS